MQVRSSPTPELLSVTECPVNPSEEQDAEMDDEASQKPEVLCTESQELLLDLQDPLATQEATPTTPTHVTVQTVRTSPVMVRREGGPF